MASTRRATNLSLDAGVLDEARALDINLSHAAQAGIQKAIDAARAKRWLDENAEAIESMNEWVEKNGLPLDKYRAF